MTLQVVPVGLLTSYIRELFEADDLLADVWVEGEVGNVFRAQSGHVYFTLKDGESQLKCALFRAQAVRQPNLPGPGDQVAAHGRVTVYEREGAYQLYVDLVQPAGLGILALQLERLRQRLAAEGLFEPARKRPLPAAPRAIGVVTSPDGAVWHDIQNVIRRRYPFVELILSPARVQGDGAPTDLIAALEALQFDGRAEVILLARGGGSAEDLWAFNDEGLARAVFACRVPVVAGVGHETDWTVVDDVADLRAPTPSAAAELCVPAVADLVDHLLDLRARLGRKTTALLDRCRSDRHHLTRRLDRLNPARSAPSQRRRVADLTRRAGLRERERVAAARARLGAASDLLAALAPSAVVARGYAALSDPATGQSIGRIAQVQVGATLDARLADGSLAARIERLHPSPLAARGAR